MAAGAGPVPEFAAFVVPDPAAGSPLPGSGGCGPPPWGPPPKGAGVCAWHGVM